MENILVSLISLQTIPNVQLIKEFRNQVDKYLFITTEGMEKKGVRNSIIRACRLDEAQLLDPIEVNQFSFDDIDSKLDEIDFDKYGRVIVNLTGGTKIMTLAAFDYFKEVGADIYYVTGQDDNTHIKISPGRNKKVENISSKVNLAEFLESYGFEITYSKDSGINADYTNKFFEKFINGGLKSHETVINALRLKCRNKKNTLIDDVDGLKALLDQIQFPLADSNKEKINKYEVKYLTGEWFEEYVANRLITELDLTDEFISTGIELTKTNKRGNRVKNEMDVVFVYNNKIYTIECKTSVFVKEVTPDGSIKERSIIGETLYKSDSLKHGLGLFPHTFLFILDSLADYSSKLKSHLERADLYNIKVIDRDKIKETEKIHQVLNIN